MNTELESIYASLGFVTRAMTQKARGIEYLRMNNPFYGQGIYTIPYTLITDPVSLECLTPIDGYPYFARPCPVNPCHGFVDSRLVYSKSDVESVWAETRKHDPQGEMLLMTPIKAEWNAILANDILSFGPGNDGATSGKDSISLPLAPVGVTSNRLRRDVPDVLIAKGETPYYEFVGTDSESYVTQARSGPAFSRGGDFIPNDMVCNEVLQTNGEDLIEWGNVIGNIEASRRSGLIVYHPGGNCADHYTVHCRLHGIAILSKEKPVVGEFYSKRGETFDIEWADFRKGYRKAFNASKHSAMSIQDAFKLSIIVLHSITQQFDSELVGYAFGLFVKVGMILCIGEARYSAMAGGFITQHSNSSRHSVYTKAWAMGLKSLTRLIRRAAYAFKHDAWTSGFGGAKWYQSAMYMIKLHNCVVRLDSSLLAHWNVAVNLAHNGGWLFNKVCTSTDFDNASTNPLRLALTMLPGLYRVLSGIRLSENRGTLKSIRVPSKKYSVNDWAGLTVTLKRYWGQLCISGEINGFAFNEALPCSSKYECIYNAHGRGLISPIAENSGTGGCIEYVFEAQVKKGFMGIQIGSKFVSIASLQFPAFKLVQYGSY